VNPAGANSLTAHADVAAFRRLFERSSKVDAKLRTALRKNIRQAGGQALDAVRTELGTGPLRSQIAAGLSIKVMTGARAGVTIVASSRAMDPGKEPLVRAWESKKGWRHPVHGSDTDTWVPQMGHPYFRRSIFGERGMVRKAVEDAMAEALRSLE
jgi:hypothetical protein